MLKSRMKTAVPDIELWLSGEINEANDLPALPPNIPGRLTIDLEGVTLVNSSGARNWVTWIQAIKTGKGIYLRKCSHSFIHQSNILVGFLGREARVESVFVVYHCAACSADRKSLVEIPPTARSPQDIQVSPTIPCPNCGAAMEMDAAPSRFFGFVARMAAS